MITTKRPNTDDYTQVGFIEAKDNQGNYQNIDKIYDNQGNIVFQQGYLNEYQGADDFGIPAIGKPLIDYTIWGNSVQSGTPTPDSPIEPEFVGDLVSIELDEPLRAVGDYKDALDLETKTYTKRIQELVLTGEENWEYNGNHTFLINNNRLSHRPLQNEIQDFKIISNSYAPYKSSYLGGIYAAMNNIVAICLGSSTTMYGLCVNNININSIADFKSYLAQQYAAGTPVVVWYVLAEPIVTTLSSIPDGMTGIVEGTVTQSGTPTPDNPIEPVFKGDLQLNGKYQVYKTYKIPISSAGQTKNIYLGQVPTTRKIKKLVLTGEEDIRFTPASSSEFRNVFYFYGRLLEPYTGITAIGTHFENFDGYFAAIPYRMPNNNFGLRGYGAIAWYFSVASNDFNSLEEFVTYIKEQYDNGTPFTLWYVLAEPETGIVNEPLCRIGDYADSVDFSQAGVEIPTLKKPNTTVIDVETSLEPSEIDVTYRGSTKPQYDLFLAKNGESFEAKDGQSLYIGGNP